MILDQPYNKDTFEGFLKVFIPDFVKDSRPVRTHENSILTEVTQLGTSKEANVTILEAVCEETDSKKRIAITQAAFKVLRDHSIRNALIAFHDGADQWRLSLLTSTLELKDGKIIKKDSNPRRYSYLLGVGAKTRTPYKYLIEKGSVSDIKSLQSLFSVEVVNKQFYESIATLFTKLVGGERGSTMYPGLLRINGEVNQSVEHQEFAVRLIGRIIFSWFLKEKKSSAGVPIIPNELLSLDAVARNSDYYHNVLEPLFFDLLNKRVEHRHESLREAPFSTVPYLNGGLFSSQPGDFYNQKALTNPETLELTIIPDDWFTELFTLLEQYNFTVDENTSYDVDLSIDPEMLGRIFENLLAEINPETGESARKSTGSFYTPREIVDYMVDSSLLEFLKNKTGADEQKLRALISWGQDDDELHPLTDAEKEKVVGALSNLTILDPACGSGAFPIGILQKVVYVLQQVDENAELWLQNQLKTVSSPEIRRDIEERHRNENYDYLRKLGVIRESIFGVDIQTIATEISKLRCFLTLVIEEDVDDNVRNRGIRPLPNLDFKFVTANSLIGLPASDEARGLNLFEDVSHIDRLKDIRNRYFGADADERARLQVEFKDLQLTMFKSRLASMGATSDLYNILSDWNPFSHDKTEWFDAEWMFGIEGFDIVIANPPYVGEKGHKTMFDLLKQTALGKKFYKGKMDLFYFFFHLGLNKLTDKGILSFISTNYYPTADGALKLRKDFYERTNVIELINFNEYKIFESALGQHNLITLLQKTVTPNEKLKTKQTFVKKRGGPNASELSSFLQRAGEDALFTDVDRNRLFDGDSFYIRFTNGGSAIDSILDKVANNGKKLSDLCLVNQGIVSGADKFSNAHHRKFPTINATKSDGIFVVNKGELGNNEFLKPWYKNSDINRYVSSKDTDEVVVYARKQDADIFPANLLAHLNNFREVIDASSANSPYLHRPRGDIFDCPKIVAPQRSKVNTFAYNDIPWYGSADIYFITNKEGKNLNLKSILSILNSKLMYVWLYNRGKRKGETLELYGTPLSQIPIVLPTDEDENMLTELVDDIIARRTSNPNADISAQEAEINRIVYKLYGLTEDEIKIIENTSK
jgi:hypothetical protein